LRFAHLDGPWSSWIEIYEPSGELCYAGFAAGLFPKYLEHLLEHPECREEAGVSLESVKGLLEAVNGGLRRACVG